MGGLSWISLPVDIIYRFILPAQHHCFQAQRGIFGRSLKRFFNQFLNVLRLEIGPRWLSQKHKPWAAG
jgi:hypothetical protein